MIASLLAMTVFAAAPDAGAARLDVKRIVDEVFGQRGAELDAERARGVEVLRAQLKDAPPADKQVLERTLRLLESKEPPQKLAAELIALLREVTPRARGDWESERALGGAWLSAPTTASAVGLDPAPLRREAMAYVKDLTMRYPSQARAHGLVASALMDAQGDPKEVLAPLKRCAELDPSVWCSEMHARLVASLEQPRCSGNLLKRPLTLWKARLWEEGATGRVVEQFGEKWVLEAEPFIRSGDFSEVTVEEEGALSLVLEAAAAQRFAAETEKLAGRGAVVLMLSDEVLLAARVQDRIANGRLRVTPGKKPRFALETLCSRVERPKVNENLKLK